MNERLNAFRERLHSKGREKKDRSRLKDWVAPLISLAALSVTIAVTYYNILRQVDDVRVVISELVRLNVDDTHATVKTTDQSMIFINSGTRSAAATKITLYVNQIRASRIEKELREQKIDMESYLKSLRRCYQADAHYPIRYNFEPIVIKPSDISVVKMSSGDSEMPRLDTRHRIELKETDDPDGLHLFYFCVQFSLVTPDNVSHRVDVAWYLTTMGKGSSDMGDGANLHDWDRPASLLQKSETIFSK